MTNIFAVITVSITWIIVIINWYISKVEFRVDTAFHKGKKSLLLQSWPIIGKLPSSFYREIKCSIQTRTEGQNFSDCSGQVKTFPEMAASSPPSPPTFLFGIRSFPFVLCFSRSLELGVYFSVCINTQVHKDAWLKKEK